MLIYDLSALGKGEVPSPQVLDGYEGMVSLLSSASDQCFDVCALTGPSGASLQPSRAALSCAPGTQVPLVSWDPQGTLLATADGGAALLWCAAAGLVGAGRGCLSSSVSSSSPACCRLLPRGAQGSPGGTSIICCGYPPKVSLTALAFHPHRELLVRLVRCCSHCTQRSLTWGCWAGNVRQ